MTIITTAVTTLYTFDLKAQFIYEDDPALEVLSDIQERTEIRFLYREALLSGISLNFSARQSELIEELSRELYHYNLTVSESPDSNQFLILRNTENPSANRNEVRIKGQVVDARTGDRLPFSTISWKINGTVKGLPATDAGTFELLQHTDQQTLEITASHIGYQQKTVPVSIQSTADISDLTIRLEAEPYTGSEIVILRSSYFTTRDSLVAGLVRTDRFSPMGDGNAVRALQILPSVKPTTALNDGLSIRGSAPDGFQLELDGIKIFNQSHLFGLLDSFNEDAVKNSSFYYGVTPAYEQGVSGGKLALTTKNGSLNSFGSSSGISNTSLKTTLHGPLKKGKSSLLVSGRISLMEQVSWLNNRDLIQWGLDVERPNSGPSGNQIVNANLVTPKNSSVQFFDLHGKFYTEGKTGSRTILSTYFGGDKTSHTANRITRTNSLRDRFREIEVNTNNTWNNFAGSIRHQRELSGSVYSQSLIGVSAYETSFSKDDFIYTDTFQTGNTNQTIVFTSPLSNMSTMNRIKVSQLFNINMSPFFIKAGAEGYYHRGEYLEESFDRPLFFSTTTSLQADFFAHLDWRAHPFIHLSSGFRSHFYSNGNYLKLSPRLKTTFFPDSRLSLFAGYSNNYQFLNRISFSNAVTADLWILANTNQPPTSTEQVTGGLSLEAAPGFYIQAEAYQKNSKNIRLHELNTPTLANFSEETPWFFNNNGEARGIEVMARYTGKSLKVTQTYSISSAKLQNDLLNSGISFFAPWDRKHSSVSLIEINLHSSVSIFASYTLASGTVNFLPRADEVDRSRLPVYQRLDLSALFSKKINQNTISAKLSIFNALDTTNTWYREIQPVIASERSVPAIRPETVEVYDFGIQPSFEVKLTF